jgi:hypothetical protein
MITCICRISYPVLFEPKPNPSGAMKYSCSLLIPKTDTVGIKAFLEAIEKAKLVGKEKLWKGKIPHFRYMPLRDGDAELESGEKEGKEYTGMHFINCSSNDPPGVVGSDAKPLMDQADIFAGCYVRADVNPFPYDNSGNRGVGWGLNNIMLTKPGDRLDGRQRAEDAFGSYAAAEGSDEDAFDGVGGAGDDLM